MRNDVTLVIRSVGERTEYICERFILEQGLSEKNVFTVRESPFSSALRKSFKIGLENGLPWTLCIDADVLLRSDAIETMIHFAEQQENNICEINGFVLDKFFGGPRFAGNRIYRTSLLTRIIDQIPPEGVDIRPEAYILRQMEYQGFPNKYIKYVVGIHDYEQYYKDIFRKCFIHAHKHPYHADHFLTYWREKASDDIDYQVALKGFAKGVEYNGVVLIDFTQEIYQKGFSELQINEKESLQADEYPLKIIDQKINNWIEPLSYQKRFPTKMGLKSNDKEKPTMKDKIIHKAKVLGPIKLLLYITGWLLEKVGNSILSWTDK